MLQACLGRAQPSIMNSQRRLKCCLLGHALKEDTGQIYNNLTKIQHISVSVGLTPAHMGKTGGCWVKAACWWAHPAHTGNATLSFQSSFTTTAHPPPAYEEHGVLLGFRQLCPGSSPRIRGTPPRLPEAATFRGLIPAHTGNPVCSPFSSHPLRAHPRAYGEPSAVSCCQSSRLGSSPRIRGTLDREGRFSGAARLIPVHTGNPTEEGTNIRTIRAHPRAYGEPFTRSTSR